MNGEVTQLLAAWRAGDGAARDDLIAIVLPELRAAADRQLRGEWRQHTLQPTALVNEVYLRLTGMDRLQWQDRAHFVRVAARLMREILIDHARRRSADKRGADKRVALTDVGDVADAAPDVDVLHLNEALERLERIDPEKSRIVELRYFGGLSIAETAEALTVSPATVKRHWQSARAWLFDALSEAP